MCLQAYAEQSFLDWFFKYTAWHLPMEYNMNFAFLTNNATVGGSGELLPNLLGECCAQVHVVHVMLRPFRCS